MSWVFQGIGGDVPWLLVLSSSVVLLLLSLHEKPEGGVVWLGFIGWDDESPENEAFSDFMVEGECDQGC